MQWNVLRRSLAASAFVALLAQGTGLQPARADDQNPGVARISVLNGYGVVIQRADSNDTVAAAINAPLMVGDYISTDSYSRAEIQIDYATFLRIGPDTQLRFVTLDPQNNVAQLAQGTVDLSVIRQTGANPEVDTPSIGVRSDGPGRYVISVMGDGSTQVTARSGRAEIDLASGSQPLDPGSTLYASGDASYPQISTGDPLPTDAFDSWNSHLDSGIRQALNYQYTGQIYGASDLYSAGRWIDVPPYGYVWTPYEPAGWAPYRAGSWVWQPYYGWTWVSTESWGWAPYHYGRWFYANGAGWCWTPGPPAPAYSPPVWQPALVVFIGFGAVAAGGGAFGNIGWVPLAPHDVYHPWWGRGFNNTHVTNITNITNVTNVTNITNITNVYVNARVTGGVTAVSTQHFNQGVFTHPIPVAQTQLRSAHLITSTVPIVPTTQNLTYTNKPIPSTVHVRPPNPAIFRGFKTAPPPPVQTFTQARQQTTLVTQKVYPHVVIPGVATPRAVVPPGMYRTAPPSYHVPPSGSTAPPVFHTAPPPGVYRTPPPTFRTPPSTYRPPPPYHTAPPPGGYRTAPPPAGIYHTPIPYHTPSDTYRTPPAYRTPMPEQYRTPIPEQYRTPMPVYHTPAPVYHTPVPAYHPPPPPVYHTPVPVYHTPVPAYHPPPPANVPPSHPAPAHPPHKPTPAPEK
jgi:hypothetical protein